MNSDAIQGWFNYSQLYDQMIAKYPKGRFVEVGAWKGKSAAYMATHLRPKQSFFVVDHFEGDGRDVHRKLLDKMDVPLRQIFERNMEACGVADKYTLLHMPSVKAATHFEPASLQFVFVDAGHRYHEVVEDIRAWLPTIAEGGTLAGHDYEPGNQVYQAVNDLIGEDNITIYNNCWIGQPHVNHTFQLNQPRK